MTRSVSLSAVGAALALVLTGCSSSEATSSADRAGCYDIAPYGGIGKIQTASDLAAAAENGDMNDELREKADDLTSKLEEIIPEAGRTVSSGLEDVSALTRALATGTAADDLPREQFQDGVDKVLAACFPDKQVSAYVQAAQRTAEAEARAAEIEAAGTSEEDEPGGAWIDYSCSFGEIGDSEELPVTEYQDAWEQAKEAGTTEVRCTNEFTGGRLTDVELKAVEKAYGKDYPEDSIATLYGICAKMAGIPIDEVRSGGQADELAGAVMVCPDHPKIDTMKATVVSGEVLVAEEKAKAEAVENGTYIASRDTPYRVGTEVQPGTYRTTGEFSDCYWEISDAAGNIMDNNFATFATDITVTIPATAAGFTTKSCGGWMKVG